ncbi:MAG: (d)CMP kinase [Oscillospiraceae bacterium]|nr:(d)CMP kinase [Oscillospiraceae bacterium]
MFTVAIDGPSGAGKSTIAKRAAKEFGFLYMDTGALYRAVGLYMLRCGIDTDDEQKVSKNLDFVNVGLNYENGIQRVTLNREDVSEAIRKNEVSMAASNVSAHNSVRKFLLAFQRDTAQTQNTVMDGRDIGTVVLPDAQVKIFLTATGEARTKRRVLQLTELGQKASYETILAEIEQRDYNDIHREHCALKQAPGAVYVDTTNITLEESVNRVIDIIRSEYERFG